jgi:1-acyl-sn-glycerol-3-phosphate acyltransferase
MPDPAVAATAPLPDSPPPGSAGSVKQWIGRTIMRLGGWTSPNPPAVAKAVLVCCPHTSNWDFVWFVAITWSWGHNTHWMGKKSLFKGPLGSFMRAMGGIPVDRSARINQVSSAAKTVREAQHMLLAVAPDGTRGKSTHWKTGFYHIAQLAGVPLLLGFLDYPKKSGGFGAVMQPSGNLDADLAEMQRFYAGIVGAHPERMSPIRWKEG